MEAVLGLDTSAYENSVKSVQSETKKTVAELSSQYAKAQARVRELGRQYDESVQKTGANSKATKELSKEWKSAQTEVSNLEKALKKTNSGLVNFESKIESSGESMASAMTKAQLLSSAIQKITSVAVSFGEKVLQSGIDYNIQLETYQTAYTNLMGSAEKASAFLQQLQQDAARTPFNMEALVQANQYLLGAGENAEYSRKTILALGDAVKATGGGNDELNRMAQNLQQVANVGKASAVDIKQFAFAGINIYQVLADYTGKSIQNVQSMTITYDVLTKALQAAAEEGGRYYNAMGIQSQTLDGRLTTLEDNAKQLAAALTSDLASAFGQLVSKANGLVVAMKDGWDTDGFQGMMAAAAEAVPQLESVANALAWIHENADILIPILTTLGTAFLYAKVYAGAQGLLGAITALLNPTNLIIAGLGLFAGALVTAYTQCEPFRNAVNGAFSTLSSVAGDAINWTVDKIHDLISAVSGAIAALNALKNGDGWKAAKSAYTSAYQQKQNGYSSKKWANDHAYMEWDENDGWVTKGTSSGSSGNGTSRPVDFKNSGVNSGLTGGGGSSGKKSGSKSTTETVISSISSTATTTAQNALGTVTTSIQTLTEKVKDSAGSIKDRITETTTTTGKEMVNGVATTFKQVETKVNGTVTKVTKTYDDMSKTLLGTFTNVSETTFDGITTKVQQAVEKYADGSEHIKKTVTETGQRIGENGAETYEKIITYIDGIQDKVTETSNEIDKSVKGTQSRIDQQLSEASGQLDKGIFGLVKSAFTDAKNGDWGGLALDFVNLIWGEVSQGQRDVISDWLNKALTAVNEGYSGGGIGKAFDIFQKLFADGGVKSDIDGVTNSVKAFGEIVNGLAGSGGVGGALGSIVQDFSGMAGGITSALGNIVSFVAANPVLALILGVGAVAGGIGLAMWMNKKNDQQPVSHYQSPFDKTGVYDSLGTFSTRAALQYRVTGQQSIVDRQTSILERIEGMLDEHLPDIGKGQVVMDSGELVGVLSPRMATNVDARIGVTVTRKARGV